MNKETDSSSELSWNATKKLILFIGFILLTVLVFWLYTESDLVELFDKQESIQLWISQLGLLGPLAIILLIATAIIISPIPSAPVALVSGALYGHTLGTIYVVFGAITGAVIAFMIARKLGYDYVNKKISHYLPVKLVGSQNMLMLIVFLTRLAPFISFDVISYAAGLTNLTLLRFFVASFIGILPVSFLLAHLGSEATNGEMQGIGIALLLLGAFTLISMFIHSKKKIGSYYEKK